MMLKQACLVLLLCYEFVNLSRNDEEDLSKRIFESLRKVLDYIYENRQAMNVDGLFGIVFVEVHLKNLNDKLGFLDTETLNYEKNKISKILKTTNLSQIPLDGKHKIFLRYLLDANLWQKNISFYFGNFNKNLEMIARRLNVKTCSEYKRYMRNDYFSEEISDQCMVQLIKRSIVKSNQCHIDELCSDYMMDNNNYIPAYGATHRLLFLQIAEARKCNWNKKWMDKKIDEYCSYIYWEAQKNAECGFISEFDDLFLEQILLCGYEGFIEFLPRKWMEYVLNIQTRHGCFGIFNLSPDDNENELRKRRKRESNVIQFGCLDHTTGLGAGVLSLFLRFLGESSGKLKPF